MVSAMGLDADVRCWRMRFKAVAAKVVPSNPEKKQMSSPV
jgi:hypothetical protein